ncbi:MAG: hypothetical protein A4E35_02298 [Methanoregula sp. PtaU1.Bin051]|nr:MAG: hypothetical protein A4E35_02298 [Methanoregula sp. PtaU1.Bin051]
MRGTAIAKAMEVEKNASAVFGMPQWGILSPINVMKNDDLSPEDKKRKKFGIFPFNGRG